MSYLLLRRAAAATASTAASAALPQPRVTGGVTRLTRLLCTATPPPPGDGSNAQPNTATNTNTNTSASVRSGGGAAAAAGSGARQKDSSHATAEETKEALQAAVLGAVALHGWTPAAVSAGLTELGWSPAAGALLPHGVGSVLAALERNLDEQLALHLRDLRTKQTHATGPESERGGEKADSAAAEEAVAYAMAYRLALQEPWHASWRQALLLRARADPAGALRARLLFVDEVAHHARLGAPDMSWYADRAVLATLYQAAELRWAADNAATGAARAESTKRFVERRVAEAMGARRRVGEGLAAVAGLSDAAAATARTVLRAVRGGY